MGSEDAACNRLTELALNDVNMAGSILAEAVSSSPFAMEAVAIPEAHEAFQKVCACSCDSCAASASLTATGQSLHIRAGLLAGLKWVRSQSGCSPRVTCPLFRA